MKDIQKRLLISLAAAIMLLAMMSVVALAETTSYVCKIGNIWYEEVSEAVAEAESGDTITLMGDVSTTLTINAEEKNLTLNLNGKTIPNITVKSGTLRIKNGNIIAAESFSFFWIYEGATVYVEDVHVEQQDGANADAAIYNAGELHIVSGSFKITKDGTELSSSGNDPVILTAETGTTALDLCTTTDLTDWETASCFTATENSAVATIGRTGYYPMERAVDAAKDGDTITLMGDVSRTLTINAEGKNLTLNLNGKTIPYITVNSGTLRIKNGSIIAAETFSFFWICEGATVYVEDVHVEQQDGVNADAAIYNAGELHIVSGSFKITKDGTELSSSGNDPVILTAEAGTTALDLCTTTDPTDWETASCFTATVNSAAAMIGETGYYPLQKAADAAKDGDTITLMDNVSTSVAINAEGKKLTLNLNGYNINEVVVNAVEKLLIKNGSIIAAQEFSFFYIDAGATVYVEDVHVEQQDGDKAVAAIHNGGTLHIISGTFKITKNGVDLANDGTKAVIACTESAITEADVCTSTNPEDWANAACFTATVDNHIWEDAGTVVKAATCQAGGTKLYHCTNSNDFGDCTATNTVEYTNANAHKWGSSYTVDVKATASAAGSKSKHCTVSGCSAKSSVTAIPKIASVTLATAKYVYDGKIKKPTVVVKNGKGSKLVNGTDYKVTYATGRKNVGRYKVTVTFKGGYSGSKVLYFNILPKAATNTKAAVSTATGGYDDIKVTWTKATGASGYKVYYKKATASSYKYLTSVTGAAYTKKNLTAGVKYTFKIVPYFKSGTTKYVSTKYSTASATTLKKVAGVKAVKSGSKVKISWTNINGETGYQISKSTKKAGTTIVATYKTTTGKSKLVKATKGKTYYYKVRAYKVVNGKKVFGPWSAAVKFKR